MGALWQEKLLDVFPWQVKSLSGLVFHLADPFQALTDPFCFSHTTIFIFVIFQNFIANVSQKRHFAISSCFSSKGRIFFITSYTSPEGEIYKYLNMSLLGWNESTCILLPNKIIQIEDIHSSRICSRLPPKMRLAEFSNLEVNTAAALESNDNRLLQGKAIFGAEEDEKCCVKHL